MPKMIKKRSAKYGLAPGTPIHIGGGAEGTKITMVHYSQHHFAEKEIEEFNGNFVSAPDDSITWINVEGLPEISVLENIGNYFKLHSLVLEDIVNTDHRPKMEDYGDYIFFVLKALNFNEKNNEIEAEQISIVLGNGYVISFKETKKDVFRPVKERIEAGKGRIRTMKSDYLAYSLIDIVIDSYFGTLERFGDMIDILEELFILNPSQGTLKTFHKLKREMLFLRKTVWPLRDVIGGLERGGSKLITEPLVIYLRDIYDHIAQIIDIIETFRDMLSEMLDIYMSGISNRINEVMKVLTIITTIFIPLSFIAGIYGMNFRFMPELDWRWGYPATLFLMAGIGLVMVLYFRRKKWF